MTYVVSGIYSDTSQVNGCDSITSIDLTINNTLRDTSTVTACDSYFWSANGMTYVMSGIYSDTSQVNGCDSITSIDLTINNTLRDTSALSACNSYFWSANGMTYVMSGIYSDTSQVNGCDSITSIDLTINNSFRDTTSVTSCDTYTWLVNNQSYTASGLYSDTSQTTFGCDSINFLQLTIDSSIVANAGIDQTLCEIDVTTLDAQPVINATGSWSSERGLITFADTNSATSGVSGLISGANQLYWMVEKGVCPIVIDTVVVTNANNPLVNAGADTTIFKQDKAILQVNSSVDGLTNTMYQWEPAFFITGSTFRTAETNDFLENSTEFTIQVTSPEGCIGKDSVFVTVNESLTFSSGFTPNGDGVNDIWEIKNLQDPNVASHEVTIFDGFGSVLLNTTDFQGWDGNFNSNPMPVSSYYYTVKINFMNGDSRIETGIVTILR